MCVSVHAGSVDSGLYHVSVSAGDVDRGQCHVYVSVCAGDVAGFVEASIMCVCLCVQVM